MNRPLKIVICIGILLMPLCGFTQSSDLSSPFWTIVTHYDNLSSKPQNPEIAATALYAEDYDQKELEEKALKLFRIYIGKGMFLGEEEIPKDPNFIDTTTGKSEYHPFPKEPAIFLVRYGKKWLYSEFTVNHIDQLYQETYPMGEDKLLEFLPRETQQKFFGIELWKYLAIVLLAVLGSLIYLAITYLLKNWIARILRRFPVVTRASKLILRISRPISFLVVLGLLKVAIPLLQFPVFINHTVLLVIGALVPLMLTIIAYRVVDLVSEYFQDLSKKTDGNLDDQLVPLVRKVLKTVIITLGVVFVLIALEINVVPLLTGLSIGGLAFALAAQDTIKNFFGSIMIFVDKPFQIGDWIVSGEIDGEVEEVGLRSTRVRTFKNSVVYVPNGKIADSIIDNYGLRAYRRMNISLSITYDTPPEIIEAFVEGLKKMVMEHPHTWKDKKEIHFNNMGDSGLRILFYIFFKVPNWHEELAARHDVLLKIMKLAKALDVNFAFPTQTIHIENLPGRESLSPVYETDPESISKRLDSFFKETNNENRN